MIKYSVTLMLAMYGSPVAMGLTTYMQPDVTPQECEVRIKDWLDESNQVYLKVTCVREPI